MQIYAPSSNLAEVVRGSKERKYWQAQAASAEINLRSRELEKIPCRRMQSKHEPHQVAKQCSNII